MATLDQITAGIVDVLETTIGLRATDYPPEQVNPPAAFVLFNTNVEGAFGQGSMDVQFDIVVLAARTSPRIGTATLNEFTNTTGPKSIWVAINAHDDLGLADGTQARIIQCRNLGVEEIGLYSYLGRVAEIMVTSPG